MALPLFLDEFTIQKVWFLWEEGIADHIPTSLMGSRSHIGLEGLKDLVKSHSMYSKVTYLLISIFIYIYTYIIITITIILTIIIMYLPLKFPFQSPYPMDFSQSVRPFTALKTSSRWSEWEKKITACSTVESCKQKTLFFNSGLMMLIHY